MLLCVESLFKNCHDRHCVLICVIGIVYVCVCQTNTNILFPFKHYITKLIMVML